MTRSQPARPPRRKKSAGPLAFAGYEHRTEPLAPMGTFYRRVLRNAVTGGVFILGSLAIGVVGYKALFNISWVDAILNASMILTGMGPVDRAETTAAKLFASGYAIFSGVAFLTSVGVIIAPLVHRFLHRFHLETEEEATPGQ